MLDIKFLRENPDIVKENIKKKFQDHKLPLVDEVIELDKERREVQAEADAIRAEKNQISKQIGALMAQGKKEEAEEVKKKVAESAARLKELEEKEPIIEEKVKAIMMRIPNIIDSSVPVGKDDSENVEVKRYGEPVVPDYEIPYHAEIMERGFEVYLPQTMDEVKADLDNILSQQPLLPSLSDAKKLVKGILPYHPIIPKTK